MLDLYGLNSADLNVQVFIGHGNAASDWQTWRKPRGIAAIEIIAIGAGGGGGGGFTRASGAAGGGGGGGGPGAISRIIIPAGTLPEVLHVFAGGGGAGGAA